MVDPQGRMKRLRKMLVERTSLNGPVCGSQYCPVKKTPIFLLILHHYLKSTKTYLNQGNRGTMEQGTGEQGEQGKQEEQWTKGDEGNTGIWE